MKRGLLFAIVVLVCAAADASYMWDQPEAHYVTETAAFGKIMAIKQQSDIHFGAVHLNNLLGDTSELPKPVQKQAEDNARIEGLMVQVDQHLAKQNELLAMSADENSLGEANQLGAEESAKFAKILVRDPRKVAETIHNVVSYMGHLVKGGQALTEEQMDDARKWYIDTTALVLGRYAYDDTKADMKGQGMAFDALKSRAEAAEHRMDTVDAARHLHKMQADDMIDSKNMNIVDMLSKTGNLASFLSEIEAAEIRKRPTAAYVKQEQETLQQMEMHEGEITAAIDELMKKVELGDAITGKAMHFQHPSSTKQRLKNELMDAASKEDSARIVQAAGKVAEKKITDELNFMKTMPPKQPKYEEPPEHKGSRGTPPREVGGPTPLRSNEDLKAPVGMLARSVSSSINGQLDGILELFNKRKAHHKSLSVKEHQTVNSQLRSITANLMQKYSLLSEAQQKPAEEPREEQEPKVDPADRVAQKAKTARLLAKSFGMPLAKARSTLQHNAEHPTTAQAEKNERSAQLLAKSFGMPLAKARSALKKNANAASDGMGLFNRPKPQRAHHDGGTMAGLAAMMKMPLAQAMKFQKTGAAPAAPVEKAPLALKAVKQAQKPTTPKAKKAPAKGPHTWSHKGEVKKEETAMASGSAEAPSQINSGTGPLPPGAVVKKFIYDTLGSKNVRKLDEVPMTLAELLKGGVRLNTGGTLHFMMPFGTEE